MIGSPNMQRGVYNGSSDTAVPGSGIIQKIFTDYFNAQGSPYTLLPFDGRSDYAAFMDEGIPAGGLFTGAEVKKTLSDKLNYGGIVSVPYDPCYHQACDNTDNIDQDVYLEMAQGATHALQTLFDHDNFQQYLWPHKNIVDKQGIQNRISEMKRMTPLVQASFSRANDL